MRVLLVAPEITQPYSEGRKRFVIDLGCELANQDEVILFSTGVADPKHDLPFSIVRCETKSRIGHFLCILRRLSSVLRSHHPEVVICFPYGTFSGIHYWPSRAFIAAVDIVCRMYRIPCATLLYSLDRYTLPQQLTRWVSHLIPQPQPFWTGHTIPLGLKTDHWPLRPDQLHSGKRILFLAGMWQSTRERVEHVMEVRGLRYLLQAGQLLSAAGVTALISIPLLASEKWSIYLREHPENTWPDESITFTSLATIPEIFYQTDVFVFPYAEVITQFTPTSVLEAMFAGTPVVLSNLPFLQHLAQGGKTASLFTLGDNLSLAQAVIELLENPTRWQTQTLNARAYAEKNWSISHTATKLRRLLAEMTT